MASVSKLFGEIGGGIGRRDEQYAFKDNGSNILAVAHCDFQPTVNHFAVAKLTGETLIFCPRLDDRLGVYTVLDFLPALGVNVDVLLTDKEEVGQSTAEYFKTDKKYSWVVEFDRRGVDAVVYDYDGMLPLVRPYFNVGNGTFSDISVLDIGVQAFNVGVGYYGEHTSRCHMVVEDYIDQIEAFVRMYHDKRHLTVPATHKPRQRGSSWCAPLRQSWINKDKSVYRDSTGAIRHDGTACWPDDTSRGEYWDAEFERFPSKDKEVVEGVDQRDEAYTKGIDLRTRAYVEGDKFELGDENDAEPRFECSHCHGQFSVSDTAHSYWYVECPFCEAVLRKDDAESEFAKSGTEVPF